VTVAGLRLAYPNMVSVPDARMPCTTPDAARICRLAGVILRSRTSRNLKSESMKTLAVQILSLWVPAKPTANVRGRHDALSGEPGGEAGWAARMSSRAPGRSTLTEDERQSSSAAGDPCYLAAISLCWCVHTVSGIPAVTAAAEVARTTSQLSGLPITHRVSYRLNFGAPPDPDWWP